MTRSSIVPSRELYLTRGVERNKSAEAEVVSLGPLTGLGA